MSSSRVIVFRLPLTVSENMKAFVTTLYSDGLRCGP